MSRYSKATLVDLIGISEDKLVSTIKAKGCESENDDGDQKIHSLFIGSVFSVMPSGKFYTCFANSNVSGDCPHCHGKRVQYARPRDLAKWRGIQLSDARKVLRAGGYGTPTGLAVGRRINARRRANDDRLDRATTCHTCGGSGSLSAHLDECFRERLEYLLDKHGAWLEGGEGDPCDLFICVAGEMITDESEDCDE